MNYENNYENHTVQLEDGTVGTVSRDTIDHQPIYDLIGEVVNVRLHDEQGNPVEKQGVMTSVIEVAYLDQE